MRTRAKLAIIILTVTVAGVGWGWIRSNQVIKVEVAAVTQQELVKTVTAPGEIRPAVQEVVFALLTGTIQQVFVSDQQEVTQGQKILEFDVLPLLVARDQAQANLESAKLALENVQRASPLAEEKNAAQSLVEQTQNSLNDAEDSYNANQNDTTRAALDSARTAYNQALAALKVLEQRDPTQQAINQAKAAVTAAEQALLQSQVSLGKSTLKAPTDGRIFFSTLKKGMSVTVGQELFRVYDTSQGLIFEAKADETEISSIGFYQEARVKLDAYPNQLFKGQVSFVSAQSQLNAAGEKVYLVKITLTDAPPTLRFGLSGDASIILSRQPKTLVVPFEAVRFEKNQSVVFVAEEDRLKKTAVELGTETDGVYEVLSGLSERQEVVISELENLKDGQKIFLNSSQ